MSPTAQLEAATARLRSVDLARRMGKVTRVLGLAAEVSGLEASVGDVCVIDATKPVTAEVVGFREGRLPERDWSLLSGSPIVNLTISRQSV